MMYEGTNTIQSLDLLGRKVLADGGQRLMKLGGIIRNFCQAQAGNPAMEEFIHPVVDLGDKVTKLTMELGAKAARNPDEMGAAAVDYLRVLGHLLFAYGFARSAAVAMAKQASSTDPFYAAKLLTARFYVHKILPETAMLIRRARAGSDVLMAWPQEWF